MFILKLIAGPLIGALIGYCTNFIAVKMLFKPHHPIRIGRCRLPFTPGLIPKRKDELAGAIGQAIGEVLLTKEDLTKALPAEQIKESITQSLWERFVAARESETTVEGAALGYLSQNRYQQLKTKVEDIITEKAAAGIQELNISEIVTEEGSRVIREKTQGTMMAMMVNEQVIQSIVDPVGKKIEEYVEKNSTDKIRPIVAGELEKLEASTIGSLAVALPLEKQQLGKAVDALYSSCVETSIEKMVGSIDVPGIVEEKIRAMDVVKLEELILSVMKKELNAIVNLGALIGFIIGLLNVFVSML